MALVGGYSIHISQRVSTDSFSTLFRFIEMQNTKSRKARSASVPSRRVQKPMSYESYDGFELPPDQQSDHALAANSICRLLAACYSAIPALRKSSPMISTIVEVVTNISFWRTCFYYYNRFVAMLALWDLSSTLRKVAVAVRGTMISDAAWWRRALYPMLVTWAFSYHFLLNES